MSSAADSTSNAPVSNESLIGQTLGQYRVLEQIGAGGMARVFRATNLVSNRTVALKVHTTSELDDPRRSERFLREARALARLKHPNLVSVYNVGFERDHCFFSMELIAGKSLLQTLAERGRMPQSEFLPYLGQILSALHYVHGQGIIHRDVKSSNIMIAGQRAVLMDFGLAKDENQAGLTSIGAIMGTPEYMAPECAHGETAGPATDIYSLGLVAYEALTGTLPFRGRSALNIIRQQLETEAPPLSAALPTADPKLTRIIQRCLAKQPASRYPTCAALGSEILSLSGTAEFVALAEAHRSSAAKPSTTTPLIATQANTAAATLAASQAIAHNPSDFSQALTVASAPSVKLAKAPAAIDTAAVTAANTVMLPSAEQPSAESHLAWLWVGAGFFGVILLAFALTRLRTERVQTPAATALVLRHGNGSREEIRWVEFKAEGSKPSEWYYIIERKQADGTWKRERIPHAEFVNPDDTFELSPATKGTAKTQ